MWPDLVYQELICMVLFSVLLIVWSVFIPAPLEEPANLGRTPNPSKAPWYFLGLQEMLVYFDPWIAGVVTEHDHLQAHRRRTATRIQGLGYYTLKERPFAIRTFLFGFLVLWVMLIIMGRPCAGRTGTSSASTRRGTSTSWNAVEHQPVRYFWIRMLGFGLPEHFLSGNAGILLVWATCSIAPAPGRDRGAQDVKELGFMRYNLVMVHLIVMAGMMVKILLRWTINLKYIVYPRVFLQHMTKRSPAIALAICDLQESAIANLIANRPGTNGCQ